MDRSFLRRWGLPLSLALNVFLATVIGVHWLSPGRRGPPPSPGEIAHRIAETLPKADGDILREVVAAHAADFERAHRIQHRDAPNRVRAALAAKDFSPDALRAAFDVNRAGRQLADETLAATVIEAAVRMSPEGRAKLAKWEPPHPPGGPGDPGGPLPTDLPPGPPPAER